MDRHKRGPGGDIVDPPPKGFLARGKVRRFREGEDFGGRHAAHACCSPGSTRRFREGEDFGGRRRGRPHPAHRARYIVRFPRGLCAERTLLENPKEESSGLQDENK